MFLLVKDWPVDAAVRFLSKAMRESHDKALPIALELLAQQHPQSAELNLARAKLLFEEGRDEELVTMAESLAPRSRNAHWIYTRAIQSAFRIKQPGRAVSLAGRQRGAQPFSIENQYMLIKTLFKAHRYARARSAAMLGLMQFSKDLQMMRFLALAQSQTGDSEKAIDLMETVLEERPRDAFAANFIAYSLAENNRSLERAMRLVQIALDVSPDSVSYLDTQAWDLYRQGRFGGSP